MKWLRRRCELGLPLITCSLLGGGCALDTRTLHQAPGGDGAGAATSSSGASQGGSSGSPGTNGPVMPLDLPVCVYDQTVDSECATLVENPGFTSSVEGWLEEESTRHFWDETNASSSDSSGSIRVWNRLHGLDNGVVPGAARQCIPARGGLVYDVAADVFINEGQGLGGGFMGKIDEGVTYEGQAGVTVYFHVEPNCGGPTERSFDSTLTKEVGKWIHVEGSARAPELTKSMLVRLNTLKPTREYEFTAKFDNVFVRER